MKKFLLSCFISLSAILINAQTYDKGFSFQGYAIDPDGKAMAGKAVTVKFTITPGTFTEEHAVTTDGYGVFHAIIGNSSTTKKAEFQKLDFTQKGTDYSLKVEVKETSGGTYTTISNEPMLAVPYARYAANGVPVGSIIAYGGDKNNVPEGWLLCDGSSVSQSTYSQLYSIIGSAWGSSGSSFNLPDLRGRFLRGVDDGAGNDPDAAKRTAIRAGGNTGDLVGTVQMDTLESHTHSGKTSKDGNHSHKVPTDEGADVADGADDIVVDDDYNGNVDFTESYRTSTDGEHEHTLIVDNTGGAETRPVNAAVYYIIKY